MPTSKMVCPPRGCATCRFLKITPDKDGVARLRASGAYPCIAIFEMPIKIPDCITKHPYFRSNMSRLLMTKRDGEQCPVWQPKD